METNSPLPVEAVALIESFIDRIERVLIERGMPRNQRNTVCDEVESQIHLLIDRKVESGSELNTALVASIIESMDPPESYNAASISSTEQSAKTEQVKPVNVFDVAPAKKSHTESFRTWMSGIYAKVKNRFANDQPHTDPVAIAGLILSCFGAFSLPFGIAVHGEGATVLGLLALFAGAIASGLSYWRIRNSRRKLLGKRYAAIGLLIMPSLFLNIIVALILIASRIGLVLGVMAVVAAGLYVNYRVLRRGLAWLDRDVPVEIDAAPASPTPTTDQLVQSDQSSALAST